MRRLLAPALSIVSIVVVIIVLEAGVSLFWHAPRPVQTSYARDYFFTDSLGITKAIPGGSYPSCSIRRETGEKIYDVVYTIDQVSRRVTPVDSSSGRTRFLLFFGGSFTFGEGVQDDETLPFFVGEGLPECRPYNYAFHGHSGAEMLLKVQSGTLRSEIAEKEGDLVYVFIDAHILRVIGSMRVVSTWGANRPYLFLDADGNLVHRQDFTRGRPRLTAWYCLLRRSKLLQYLDVDFPLRIRTQDVYLNARVIEEARRSFQSQFPGSNFYVVLYPGSHFAGQLSQYLEQMGIVYFDYSDRFRQGDPRYSLAPEDAHPNRQANELVAGWLVADLKQRRSHGRSTDRGLVARPSP